MDIIAESIQKRIELKKLLDEVESRMFGYARYKGQIYRTAPKIEFDEYFKRFDFYGLNGERVKLSKEYTALGTMDVLNEEAKNQ